MMYVVKNKNTLVTQEYDLKDVVPVISGYLSDAKAANLYIAHIKNIQEIRSEVVLMLLKKVNSGSDINNNNFSVTLKVDDFPI